MLAQEAALGGGERYMIFTSCNMPTDSPFPLKVSSELWQSQCHLMFVLPLQCSNPQNGISPPLVLCTKREKAKLFH